MSPSFHPAFWAKTGDDPEDYHPLIAHSADVAAVMDALIRPRGVIQDRLLAVAGGPEADVAALVAVLTYLAAIHDIGKASNGFQDRGGPLALGAGGRWIAGGHVRPLVDTIYAGVHHAAWLDLMRGLPWDEYDELPDMLLTAVCHHGRPWLDRMRSSREHLTELWDPDDRTGREPLKQIRFIAEAARQWSELPERGWHQPPFAWTPALANLFAGLLVTADWIGSSRSIFEFDRTSERDPGGYWQRARSRAKQAVRGIGLRPPQRTTRATGPALYPEAFPRVFTKGIAPTPLQVLLATVDLPAPGSRIVVESETGSGKTEAILALYARLRDAGRADGLAFALPTRATASSMLGRLEDCLGSLNPGDPKPTVALAMGGTGVDPNRDRTPLPSEGRIYDDDPWGVRGWASENAKRFFAAEIVVGTVDQVLLAGLPATHAHHRLGLLARHFLVVDELHSYDRYMTTILKSVVDLLCDAGGVAAFLSATLSSEAMHRLIGEDDPTTLQQAERVDYPSVAVHTLGRWTRHPAGAGGPPREVSWILGPLSDGLERAVHVASDGGRVCILRNTVQEARETAAALLDTAPELLWRPPGADRGVPAHARYLAGDRKVIDENIIRDFGKGSTASGTILVSTQIVEQSLDVDFDWMLTDLAPVDVLLQRAGRVHRHQGRRRPAGVSRATLFVHGPADGFDPKPGLKGKSGWGTVYEGILDLELTRRVIEQHPIIEVPRMSRALIERVYHREARKELVQAEPEWDLVECKETGDGIAQYIHGRQSALDFRKTYVALAQRFVDADEERIRTRIGDDRVSIALDRAVHAWYAPGVVANEVALSLRDVRRARLGEGDELMGRWVRDTDDGPTFELGRLDLTYGRDGWRVESRD